MDFSLEWFWSTSSGFGDDLLSEFIMEERIWASVTSINQNFRSKYHIKILQMSNATITEAANSERP